MSNVGRLRDTLIQSVAENATHATMLQATGAEVHNLNEVLLNAADHVHAAIESGTMVLHATDQVRDRLRSQATEDHRQQVATTFSIALFGTSTGLDADVSRGLVLANGGERTAENMMGVSKTRLEQAVGHLAAAYELIRPDARNTATTRMSHAETAIGMAVDARIALNMQVEDYIDTIS